MLTSAGGVHSTRSTGRLHRRDVARTDGQPQWADPAASVRTVIQNRPDDATYLRCAGCGTAAMFGHRDRQYGRLVHDFLDRHGQCGDAVEISAARQYAGPAANR